MSKKMLICDDLVLSNFPTDQQTNASVRQFLTTLSLINTRDYRNYFCLMSPNVDKTRSQNNALIVGQVSKMHEVTLLHRLEFFFLINNFFFTITVTPNPYSWSITFFLSFLFIIFLYICFLQFFNLFILLSLLTLAVTLGQ